MQDPPRPATGYPAPSYYTTTNGGNQQNPNSFNNLFTRYFVAALICLFFIFGFIFLLVWLVLRPTLPEFLLQSLTLSNFAATSQSVNGTWQARFLVRNTDKKMSITYHYVHSRIYYDSLDLQVQLLPFKQDKKTETPLNVTFSAVNNPAEKKVVDDLNGNKASGSIPFNVEVFASTVFRSGGWLFSTCELRVLCRRVPVAISSNSTSGSLSGGAKDCQVRIP